MGASGHARQDDTGAEAGQQGLAIHGNYLIATREHQRRMDSASRAGESSLNARM
jgi:hypothetical protein